MPVSHRLLEMVKRWEGFRPRAYKDASGKWTVGYGFTAIGGKPVGPGTTVTLKRGGRPLGGRSSSGYSRPCSAWSRSRYGPTSSTP
jgi:hypothetical protein